MYLQIVSISFFLMICMYVLGVGEGCCYHWRRPSHPDYVDQADCKLAEIHLPPPLEGCDLTGWSVLSLISVRSQ